ncbi:RDD family protein [Streptomyces zhaozhouensis]|uniref:RDD family protein n=1 Tax=Streptomyces zhaozhouensis TaxID=1300267 RepID=UPI001FE887BF|nr:RDD family protein [Streptomyces zhaozhouensis]
MTKAPGWRRVTAWLVDYALVVTVAVLLGFLTFHRISAMLGDVEGLAGTGVWKVVTSDGDLAEAGQALGESLWRRSIRAVQQGFALLVLATFLYQFLSLAFAGTTLGKALLGLRVSPAGGGGGVVGAAGDAARPSRRAAAVRAAVTTVADVGLLSLACCLLLSGAFLASGAVLVLTVVVFLANATPALAGDRRSLADRCAGTRVDGGLLGATAAATARYTAQGGRAAWQAAQRVAESERARAAIGRGRRLLPGGRAAAPGEVPAGPPAAGPVGGPPIPGAAPRAGGGLPPDDDGARHF